MERAASASGFAGALLEALGPELVRFGADVPERNRADATRLPPGSPLALVLPRTTADVATVLRLCHAAHQPIVTQGGMTGLAAGAHPGEGEVALSLERLRGVEEVDRAAATLTALAGTPLQEVQAAAEAAGFLCGIDLGARGSCTIGGNVATNAGGNQVLRYGMARRNVLGLEVVQADGTVLTSLNKMLKNNTGYDWTQLFIGSEGTLGVVTRVVLGLHPRPAEIATALVSVPSAAAALEVLSRLQRNLAGELITFEAMWREYLDVAVERLGLRAPFAEPPELAILVELAASREADALPDALDAMVGDKLVVDALVAQSGADRARLWAYRESVYEYKTLMEGSVGFDISIPRAAIGDAVEDLRRTAAREWPRAIQAVFGHMADSNLHIVVGPLDGGPGRVGEADRLRVEDAIYGVVRRHAGSVSAEHGIGRLKRAYLSHSRTPPELALMRTMKAALDPHGILNPGRVL